MKNVRMWKMSGRPTSLTPNYARTVLVYVASRRDFVLYCDRWLILTEIENGQGTSRKIGDKNQILVRVVKSETKIKFYHIIMQYYICAAALHSALGSYAGIMNSMQNSMQYQPLLNYSAIQTYCIWASHWRTSISVRTSISIRIYTRLLHKAVRDL